MNFRKVNNLTGWITFAIATCVYFMTMEPTVSYWDCGEFLSCAYKIEVGHSPGAPLFMFIQRMFGLLAGSNLQKVAMMINAWSALASSLTILFLFWTITHFAKRLINNNEEPTSAQTMLIMGSGIVGALAYTFSDTFWFSAVEAEVYATSSFFTALVFWAILKWEHIADSKYADRWLILISYLMGLSVGVHLLNLLAIPALAMVYYYKRYEATRMGSVIAFVIGCALLALVQFGVLQGIPVLASKFDLFFVNSLGMPFDSGAITFMIILVGVIVWALIYAKKKGHYLLHTGILCITFVIIGFSSYLAPLIRSRADVAIDMTNPDNAISLTSYLKREQFGQTPLLYGPDFDARPIDYNYKGYHYARSKKNGKDYYEQVGQKIDYVFSPEDKRFFPRIHDFNDPGHIRFYRSYLGLDPTESPTSADNFEFFIRYHIDWMWWRYFMWNYAGRQNDFEGQGEAKNGNWISGIKAFDKMRGLGDIDVLPNGYSENRARNQYYMLPFALGILGLIYQFNRNKKDGIVTFILFFFTGIAIAIYLNMPPIQPRERDYAFVGSMYAYAIWIGLGVLMVQHWLRNTLKGTAGIAISIILCLVCVPVLMAKENWDDHDRSKKRLALATARNTLSSCAPNAVLFTYGDNDTYPVWYAQEIEGIRPDVRIINTSLLGIDWYIDQLHNRINDAMPVPMIWKREHFLGDRRNYLTYYASPQIPQDRYFNIVDICKFIISDDPQSKLATRGGGADNFIPSKNMFIPGISMQEIVQKGFLRPQDTAFFDTDIKFTLPKDNATKDELAMLNIIAANAQTGWNRPIYYSSGLPGDNYLGLSDYMRLEGTVYRLMPFKQRNPGPSARQYTGSTDVEKTYDLFMNKYSWGNADRNDVYFDEKNRIMFMIYRINSARLAAELTDMGDTARAVKVMDKVLNGISERSYYYDVTAYYMAVEYYRAGARQKAKALADKIVRNCEAEINYLFTLSEDQRESMTEERNQNFTIINSLRETARISGDSLTANQYQQKMDALSMKFSR